MCWEWYVPLFIQPKNRHLIRQPTKNQSSEVIDSLIMTTLTRVESVEKWFKLSKKCTCQCLVFLNDSICQKSRNLQYRRILYVHPMRCRHLFKQEWNSVRDILHPLSSEYLFIHICCKFKHSLSQVPHWHGYPPELVVLTSLVMLLPASLVMLSQAVDECSGYLSSSSRKYGSWYSKKYWNSIRYIWIWGYMWKFFIVKPELRMKVGVEMSLA